MLYRELARGNMGEQRAVGEGIASNHADGINLGIDYHLPITRNVLHLHSFCADNLIYIHNTLSDVTSANLTLSLRQL